VKARVAERSSEVVLSAIIVGEIRYGIALLERGVRRVQLSTWYLELVSFADAILPVTREVAERWGDIQAAARLAGRALDAPDGLLAATALVHDLPLWTRNTHDFEGTGVRLFDPWED
jgi:predicted nucleic acid-binding protein